MAYEHANVQGGFIHGYSYCRWESWCGRGLECWFRGAQALLSDWFRLAGAHHLVTLDLQTM